MRGKTIERLRYAFEFCGYDFDDVMGNPSRKRIYADLRAIAWYIYQEELRRTSGQVARAFKRDHSTVYCGIVRASRLRRCDKQFSDLYDSIYGAFMAKDN